MACYEYKGVKYTEEELVKLLQSQQLKTRRILELQSDLFQKGRNIDNLAGKVIGNAKYRVGNNPYGRAAGELSSDNLPYAIVDNESGEVFDFYKTEQEANSVFNTLIKGNINSTENQFLQLLNKDNNWVTFFVKSIIQDSAKKGYEKVLFPSGNTASKVEGHTTLEDFKKEKENRINKLEEEKKTLKPIEDVVSSREMFYNRLKVFNLKKANGYLKDGFAIYSNKVSEMLDKSLLTKDVTNNPSGVGFTYITLSKEQKEEFNISIEEQEKRIDSEINQLKQELQRVETEGFGALKPIYNFYENTVTNILKKQGFNPNVITDEYGNTWNEVKIRPEATNEILFQKENSYQSTASDETIKKIKEFLNKNGISIQALEKYAKEHNLNVDGANGLADITQKIIAIAEGKENIALPEEAFHIGYAILEQTNPVLAKKLLSRVHKFNMYQKVYDEYKSIYTIDGKPDVLKIKKEAVAKLLAEAVISGENPSIEDEAFSLNPEYQPKTWWQRILNAISGLYKKSGIQLFQEAADIILKHNIGDEKINSSDGRFLQLSPEEQSTVDKLDETDKLIKKAYKTQAQLDDILLEDTPDNWYEHLVNGEWKDVKNRVTDRVKNIYNRIFRNHKFTEEQKLANNIKREFGIKGHTTIQNILGRYIDNTTNSLKNIVDDAPDVSSIPNDHNMEAYNKLDNYIKEFIKQFPVDSKFYVEKVIYDEKNDEAGTIDLLVLAPSTNGYRASIYDWKFMGNREDMPDVAGYKQGGYNIQIGTYKRILKDQYGIVSFGQTRAIPIMMDITNSRIDGQAILKGIGIGSANVKDIEELKLLPVPTLSERTGNAKIDKILDRLSAAYQALRTKDVADEDDEKELKRNRLNELKNAIRVIQTQEDFAVLLNAMEIYNTQLTHLLEKMKTEDVFKLSSKEKNDISDEFLQLGDQYDYYNNITTELNGILDKESELYKQIVIAQDNISNSLYDFDEAKKKFAEDFAAARGIMGFLSPEKVIGGLYKMFKSFDEYSNKGARLITNLFTEATQIAQEESVKFNKGMSEIIAKVEATKKGYSMLLQKGKHQLITKLSPDFEKAFNKAYAEGRMEQFIKENISNLPEYIKEIEAFRDAKIAKIEKRKTRQEWEEIQKQNDIEQVKENYNPYNPQWVNQVVEKYISNKWWSEEYTAINKPENAPFLEFYNKIIELNTIAQETGYIKYKQIKTFIPFMQNDLLDKMAKNGWNLFSIPSQLMDSLNTSEKAHFTFNKITGERVNKIPKHFVSEIEEKNLSKELGQAMILYTQSVYKYKAMSEIDNQVNLVLSVEKIKGHLQVSKNNKIILKEDGDGNLKPEIGKGNEENAKLLDAFVQYLLYENRYPLSQDITANPINSAKKMLNNLFLNKLGHPLKESDTSLSMIKSIDAINRGFQIKTLGLSPIAGAVNWFGANIQVAAQKSGYYDVAEFVKAQLRMNKIFQWTEKEGSLFMKLTETFQPFTENENYELFKKAGTDFIKKRSFADFMYSFMRKPELQIQSANFEAMIHNMMVTPDGKIVQIEKYVNDKYANRYSLNISQAEREKIFAKMKEEIRELKANSSIAKTAHLNEKGELVIPNLSLENKEEIRKLSLQSQILYKRITGGVSGTSVNAAKLEIFSSSMMVFHNWIPKLWYTRFGALEAKNDPFNRDAYDIGRIKVLMTALQFQITDKVGGIRDILKATDKGIAALDLMYEKYSQDYFMSTGEKFTMDKAAFNDMIRQNLSNQMRELGILLSLASSIFALGFIQPPDDDKQAKSALNLFVRTLDQFEQELSFFYNPFNYQQLLQGGVFPAVGLLKNIEDFTTNLLHETTGIDLSHPHMDAEDVRKKAYPIKYALKMFPGSSAWLQFSSIVAPDFANENNISVPSPNAHR